MKRYIVITIALLFAFSSYSQRKYVKPKFANNWSKPSKHPDHIVLNFSQNPATTISITWRTSEDVKVGFGEIAISDANPKFIGQAITKKAITNIILRGLAFNSVNATPRRTLVMVSSG